MTDFDETLEKVSATYRLMSRNDICLFGCKVVAQEGPLWYLEDVGTDDGICRKCHRPRYRGVEHELKWTGDRADCVLCGTVFYLTDDPFWIQDGVRSVSKPPCPGAIKPGVILV